MSLLLSLGKAVKSGNSPIIELFDETGELLCSVIEGDREVGESSVVLLVAGQTFGTSVSIVVVIDLLLQDGDVGLEPLHLLSVDVVSDSNRGGEPVDDGPKLVSSQVGSGSEDVLYGGGGQREPPRVNGGDGNFHPFFSEVAALKRVIGPKTEVSGEMLRSLFRG